MISNYNINITSVLNDQKLKNLILRKCISQFHTGPKRQAYRLGGLPERHPFRNLAHVGLLERHSFKALAYIALLERCTPKNLAHVREKTLETKT